jgi:hypothetical protein
MKYKEKKGGDLILNRIIRKDPFENLEFEQRDGEQCI